LLNQLEGKILVNAPVPALIGSRYGRLAESLSDAKMIQLLRMELQAKSSVTKAFPMRKLSEGHAEELPPAGKLFRLVVAVIPCDASFKDII